MIRTGFIDSLITGTLKKKTSLDGIFYSLTCIVIIRTFFEMLLESGHSLEFNPDFYLNMVAYSHGYLSWLCIFTSAGILLAVFLGLRWLDAMKLVRLFSPVIILVPFFDFFSTRGSGGWILYGFDTDSLLHVYLNCFNPFVELGSVTRGVRLEVLILFLSCFYAAFYVFRTSFVRALLLALSIYTMIFLYGYLPGLYGMLGMDFHNLSGRAVTQVTRTHKLLFMYLAPFALNLAMVAALLHREDRETLKSAASFLYPSRLFFYILLLAFGFLFVADQSGLYPRICNAEDCMKFLSAAISVTTLFVYAKILNDVNDVEIDRISNKGRPIAGNIVSVDSANQVMAVLLPISLIFALASEVSFIFYWLFLLATSHVYSAGPFRFRRYYPLGHLILSAIGASVFLAGGSLVKSYDAYFALRHEEILVYIFLAFFFLAHVKDFKDIEGDSAGGVFNILKHIGLPRTMGVVFMAGFTLMLVMILHALEMINAASIAGMMLFSAGWASCIATAKHPKDMERLLLLSLLFLSYVAVLWLYEIAY